ncbi:hypothetical protein [Thiopseudomonas denitrificans]|uniref:hypothetical protein n=1 Tax=Thiopseudomonas denitrificans TaxID=1501432 RepID=UPI000C7744F7|nr:hypothetical protein [Thiopseudomonas denitrificans]
MNSQVLGVLVASMAGGDEKDMQTGAWVAGNATSYNHELHLPHGMMTYTFAAAGFNWVGDISQTLDLKEMLVTDAEGIYDTGGRWVAVDNGQHQ